MGTSMQPPGPSATTTVAQPIKVGCSMTLTGDFADVGKSYQQAYNLWADWTNKNGGLLGRPVQLTIVDDTSDPDKAVANLQRLITVNKVDLLLGDFSSLINFPASAIAEQYHYVYIEAAGGVKKIFNRGFKYLFYPRRELVGDEAVPFFDYMGTLPANLKPKKIAVVTQDNIFALASTDRAQQLAGDRNITVAYYEKYAPTTTDFTPIITKVKATGADVLYCGTVDVDAPALIRACKEVGYNPNGVFMSSGPDILTFGQNLGSLANGIIGNVDWHKSLPTAGNALFTSLFKQTYNSDPDEDSAEGWAVTQVLSQAVQGTASINNDVLDTYLHGAVVQTVLGPAKFNADGTPGYPGVGPYLLQWQNGQQELVYPSDSATASLVWPKPPF